MPRAARRQLASPAARLLAITAAATLSIGLLGSGVAVAAPAGPPVQSSAKATAVASTLNVRTQTGEWALQIGSIDSARNRLYVGMASDTPKLAQIDLTTGVATAIPLGGAFGSHDTAVSPLDGTVYVSHNSYLQGVSVLDPAQSYTPTSLPPLITTGLASNPQLLDAGNDGRIYALHLGQGVLSVIGASTSPDRMNVVQSMPVLSRDGYMAIDNDRDRLYIVSAEAQTLTVIDTESVPAAQLGVIPLTITPAGVGVNSITGQVLISSFDTNSVSWLTVAADHTSATVTRTEALAALPAGASSFSQPLSINVRADGTTLVVTHVYPSNKFRSQVTVIPPVVGASKPITVATVGYGANGGVFDPRAGGTLYVPNGSQGTISEISDVTLSGYATETSVGSAGVLKATVSRSDARPFTGTVSFSDSSAQPLGTAAVDASGTAELAVGNQPIGSLAFTATVVTPKEIPLSTSGSLTVLKAPSTTTLTTMTAVEGSTATASIDVTGPTGNATGGTYTIATAKGEVLASGTLDKGRATASFTAPAAGTTSLIAHFSGDGSLLASDSAAVDLVVTARTPAATVPSAKGAAGASSSVTVTGFLPGENVNISLHSDPVFLGTVKTNAIGSGTLTFVIPNAPAGLHHIVATGVTSGRISTLPFTVSEATSSGTGSAGASAGGGSALASTGMDSPAALGVSAALLALGLGACAFAARSVRRARRSR